MAQACDAIPAVNGAVYYDLIPALASVERIVALTNTGIGLSASGSGRASN